MSETTRAELTARVLRLRAAVYSQPDPSADDRLLEELAKAEGELSAAQEAVAAAPAAPAESPPPTRRPTLLGPKTTALRVETKLRMQPLPTGIYHLLDPAKDPLLTVTV